ncbi:IucA/IucC family protein [Corynebacterium liangguodongii]|uniref:IucA/IucC family protein n=1 Tax=Corynebacterium liangguodongii TaxID=2079535 RepID=UPI0011B280D7|nr:IucA/IucC family protein [Corynebacterium liangguodongii]
MNTPRNYLAQARRSVAERLARALDEERLSSHRLDDKAVTAMTQLGPAQWLRDYALDGRLRAEAPNLERAVAEIDDAVVGLARARAGLDKRWEHLRGVGGGVGTLARALDERTSALGADSAHPASARLARCEQLVGEGHPNQPAAKTSLGLGAQWATVLPEQVEQIECRFLAAAPELVERTGTPINEVLSAQLPGLWERLERELPAGYAVIPVHPWQLERVVRDRFADDIAAGRLVELAASAPAEPLLSVRTLRVRDGEHALHIKLALEAQLTGAIRGISRAATLGPELSRVVSHIFTIDAALSPRTVEDAAAFSACEDLAGVRYSAADGTPEKGMRAHCLGAVVRRDPVLTLGAAVAPGDVVMPLATLQAPNPLTGRALIVDVLAELAERTADAEEAARAWFAALARVLAVPSLSLAARWGVALEPHPQNALVVLRHGVPHAAIVRDFGGARVLGTAPVWDLPIPGLTELRERVADTALNCGDVETLVDKITYPLLVNLWAGLAEAAGVQEQAWEPLAAACEAARSRAALARSRASEPERVALAEEVWDRVFAADLPRKRLVAMRLAGAVTQQAYVREANPLPGARARVEARAGAELASEVERARWDVDTRWRSTCRMEGLDPDCLAGGTCVLEQLRCDKAQAAMSLASARHTVRRRLADLRAEAKLRGIEPTYWNLVGLAPRGLHTAVVDSLAVEGHTVHPLAKLRRGFSEAEGAAFAPESGQPLELRIVALSPRLIERSAVGSLSRDVREAFPEHTRLARAELAALDPQAAQRAELTLVHPWQWEHVIAREFAPEIERGEIRLIRSCTIAALPTISIRTLIPLAPGARGARPFIKTAMDVVLTSTRRSMSQDSALGTPEVALLIDALVARTDTTGRTRVVMERAGVAYAGDDTVERRRGLSTLWRADVLDGLPDGEIAVSACALRGQPPGEEAPLAQLVAREGARRFIRRYATDLLGVALPLMWGYGVALESHLQNTMVRLYRDADGVSYRGLVLRDFSGLRIFEPRLVAAGYSVPTRPGAVTATDNYREFLDKGYYANVFANLSGMIDAVVDADPCASKDELKDGLWEEARGVVDAIVVDFGAERIPDGDLERLMAPYLHQKAFATMAMKPEGGDAYVDVANPLRA